MDKKLSIIQRTFDKIGWDKSNNFSPTDISNIKVYNIRNDRSLNAIPSPLARMHLFESAFELLDNDESNHTSNTGDSFKKLVSDCFDIFELIYNWNNHIRDGKKISIVKWNMESEIGSLKNNNQKHKLLGETLEVFLNDESFKNIKDIFILKIDNKVIAGSSPFTGFFTTPNDINNFNLYNPLAKRNYFSKIVPFKERKKEIKKYISDFFKNSEIAHSTQTIRNYLQKYSNDIDTSNNLHLKDLNDINNQMFGITLQSSSKKSESDYFENYLVKLNYRVNDECFHVPLCNNPERKHDYLIPLTTSFFEDYTIEDISSKVNIEERGDSTVEVTITDGEKVFKKKYQVTRIAEQDGEIIDLWDDLQLNICFSVFPIIKVENKPSLNDYYKIMLALFKGPIPQDLNNDIVNLNFYVNKKIIIEGEPNINYSRFNRTNISENPFGSSYYQINGSYFDYSIFSLQLPNQNKTIKGMFVPKWKKRRIVDDKKYKFSIDFGTTTTFVSFVQDGEKILPESFNIEKHEDLLLANFYKPEEVQTTNTNEIQYDFDNFRSFQSFIDLEIKEFIPIVIGSTFNSKFKFPLRTAICEVNNLSVSNFVSLSNANIAFGYEKITLLDKHQSFKTNLKWSIEDSTEMRVFIFLEELIKLIKFKIIVNGGNPELTDIIWFSPLSFSQNNKELYNKIWKRLFDNELKSKGNLLNMSESEAPFYFHLNSASIKNFSSVLSIDIGGGSTDFVYFKDRKPIIGSSVNFGANLLWSDGNIQYSNTRSNGIFNFYSKEIMEFLSNKANEDINIRTRNEYMQLDIINTHYLDSIHKYGSDEIINLWLSYNEKTNFNDRLSKSSFKINFLLFFCSIIYHSSQLLKASGLDKPTCICFSGNGSKVLDIITNDKSKLSLISKTIINKIYESEANDYNPEIILPNYIERKEATCFGGLYKDTTINSPTSYNYLGFKSEDFENFKEISLYKDLTEIAEKNIKDNIENFFELFCNLNNDINFKEQLGIDFQLLDLKTFLIENIEKNYNYEKKNHYSKSNENDEIRDSLFFWPLKGLLFDLSNVRSSDLKEKKVIFLEIPDKNGKFIENISGKNSLKLYKVEINLLNENTGNIFIDTNDEYTLKLIFSNIESYLLPACKYKKTPLESTTKIKTINPGIVEKRENSWFIKEKIQIEFV
jgi:hypothetical protein